MILGAHQCLAFIPDLKTPKDRFLMGQQSVWRVCLTPPANLGIINCTSARAQFLEITKIAGSNARNKGYWGSVKERCTIRYLFLYLIGIDRQ